MTESTPPNMPDPVARRTRAAAVTTTLALIVLGLAWELSLAPTGARSLAVKVLPLALLVPGMLKLRLTSYRWMSLLVWLYAAEGAMRAASDQGLSAQLAMLELTLSLVLFGACVLHVRHRLAHSASKP
jgi:uncharacterized membrane protein